jgi:predicted ferric reductase
MATKKRHQMALKIFMSCVLLCSRIIINEAANGNFNNPHELKTNAQIFSATMPSTDICASAEFMNAQAKALGSSPFTIKALVKGTEVCMEFSFPTASSRNAEWFAVGLARENSMVSSPPANVFLFQKGDIKPISYAISGYSSSEVIAEADQRSFVTYKSSSNSGSNGLSFTVQRSLSATLPTDVSIDPSKSSIFIWAYGTSWPISGHKSDTKGVEQYSFASGSSAVVNDVEEEFCSENNCTIIVAAIAFGTMILGGIMLTLTSKMACSRLFLHNTLVFPPSKQKLTNAPYLTNPLLNIHLLLSDLKIGELLIVLIFFVALIALIIVSVKDQEIVLSGQVSLFVLIFLILPVAKIPFFWQVIFGTSFERLIKFHRWLGLGLFIASFIHLILALDKVESIFQIEPYGKVVPLYGFIAFLSFAVMTIFAMEPFRRKTFALFYGLHRILSILGFIFAILHSSYVGNGLLFSLIVYGVGLIIGGINFYTNNYSAHIKAHPSTNITTIILERNEKTRQLAKSMLKEHCAYFWVYIPSVSKYEWHPFSAIVLPDGETIGFCIRSMSAEENKPAFTKKLREVSTQNQSINLSLCGPYGKVAVNVDDYEVIVLVCGGVGVTPFLNLLNQLRLSNHDSSKEYVFVWSVQKDTDLLMADAFLPIESGEMPHNGIASNPIGHLIQGEETVKNFNVNWNFHVSNAQVPGVLRRDSGETWNYKAGRAILEEYINSSRYVKKNVCILACGPRTLVYEAQTLARKCGFDFHKEEFAW